MTHLWMVTFVTHNSRVSERMLTYGVKRGEPVIFSDQERVTMLRHILDVCQRHDILLVAGNILPDHVHLILIADALEHLRANVRTIKGGSAYAFQRECKREKGHPTWAGRHLAGYMGARLATHASTGMYQLRRSVGLPE